MASISHTCPGCLTEKMALKIVRHEGDPGAVIRGEQIFRCFIWWLCPDTECNTAGAAYLYRGAGYKGDHFNNNNNITGFYEIEKFWPAMPGRTIPNYLPSQIAKAFRQGEDNFPKHGNEEAAGMMYRRALDISLKHIDPDGKGNLVNRINAAVKTGLLTKDIGDWSHNIRILGNDASHEFDGIEREELVHLRGITEMVLRYVFTLPGMVREMRGEAGNVEE